MTIQTVLEAEERFKATKASKNRRFLRCSEVKALIRSLEAERSAILRSSPEASVLCDQWKADLAYQRSEFVSELAGRAQTGRSARIRFDSPGALAFLNSDRWLEAFPEMAERASGGVRGGGRTIAAVSDEILLLRKELADYGDA